MGVLDIIGQAWDRYCRRLGPEESGALWCLVSMAQASRVRGCVVARPCVLAAALNLGEGPDAERCAVNVLQALGKKGLLTVSQGQGETLTVTVAMFGDRFERMRERERRRHRKDGVA